MKESLEQQSRGQIIEDFLRQNKSPDVTKEEVEDVDAVIRLIFEKFEAELKSHHQECDADDFLDRILATLDEAHGNFNNIFPENKVLWQEFIKKLEASPDLVHIMRIEPLDYYKDVGNVMDPVVTHASIEAVTEELKRRNPELADDYVSNDPDKILRVAQTIVQSDHFYYFIDKEMIDQEMSSSGHDHIGTSMVKLGYMSRHYELAPTFVAKFKVAAGKFDGKEKVVLDGTHRALVSAIAKRSQYVLEVDMDKIIG